VASTRGGDSEAVFCDTNVLVRLLTDDPPSAAEAADRFLTRFAGRVVLTDVIVAELVYVLSKVIGLTREETADRVVRVFSIPSVDVSDATLLADALRVWVSGRLDFADAYLAALDRCTDGTAVLSFDRDFDRIDGVERVDPARY